MFGIEVVSRASGRLACRVWERTGIAVRLTFDTRLQVDYFRIKPERSHFAASCLGTPRYFTNQEVISTVEWMRLDTLRQPWSSSGNRTYSTGTPRCFRFVTTCSASTSGTFVSLAPCSTIVAAFTWSTLCMGESRLADQTEFSDRRIPR